MSEQPGEDFTHRPQEGAEFNLLGCYLGVSFYPSIKLAKRDAHQFAGALTDYYEIDELDLESDSWIFSCTKEDFRIVVGSSQLQLHMESGTGPLETYERHYQHALDCFERLFNPQWILNSKAMVRALLPVHGDARTFLQRDVCQFPLERLDPLKRPIHVIGMRLLLPAYRISKDGESEEDAADWDIDLRLESFANDPRQLFVEADATWQAPAQWTEESLEAVTGRLGTVMEYVKTRVRGFLSQEHEGTP